MDQQTGQVMEEKKEKKSYKTPALMAMVIVAVLLLSFLVYKSFSNGGDIQQDKEKSGFLNRIFGGGENEDGGGGFPNGEGNTDNTGLKTFSPVDGTFSFSYPEYLNNSALLVGENADEQIILFNSTEPVVGFQIRISPFDEDIALTPERIGRDLPDLDLREPELISVAGVQAVVFLSNEGTLETRQIWFVRGGRLYQISTYIEFDERMVKILESWRWQE